MFASVTRSVEYGQAPEKLKVIFVEGDRIGQRLQIQGIGERTQMDYVAKQVLGFLGELGAELSFVAEYSKALKLYTNKRRVTGEGRKLNVEAITGFLISGVTVTIDGLVRRGCVRVRLMTQDEFIDVPLHSGDTVLDLKRKISQQKPFPVDKQKLKFQGTVLTNDQMVKQAGIEEGDEIWVDSNPSNLQIQMPNLVTMKIQAQNNEKIEQICLQACRDAKIRPIQIRLCRNETIIDLNRTIGEIDLSGQIVLTVNIPMIQIFLKTKINKVFDIRVERDGTVKSVKQVLCIKEGIPVEKQILVIAGITLEDGRLLQDYNIQQGMTIQLLKTPGAIIQIFIKKIKNKAFAVNIDNEEPVLELKKKITQKLGIETNEQRLIFAGKELEDEKDLQEYDIQTNSTVQLELRLIGGLPPKRFVNVEGTDSLIRAAYSEKAAEWLFPLPGLTILGECKSIICKAKGKEVLFNAGFTDFDLQLSQAFCPQCKNDIQPITPG
ncbi:MAG: putative ubiquitin 4 [Streblomastix strix]|uniref:Putative ubiquitin 4 n=1 Tax=Streblomastix strix TaxID=222440 RepID=A0A5J4W4D8_9EUKA|nr:MAG: putative ubiquitin 4 [Streblomastix strix]